MKDKGKCIVLMIVLVAAFIWLQSAVPESKSAYESSWLTAHIINPILQKFGTTVDKDTVRKIAHVMEYLVLGVFISVFWDGKPVKSIYTGLTIAFLDESIQVITKRGALITDVWIDMIGIAAGSAIVWMICKAQNKDKK